MSADQPPQQNSSGRRPAASPPPPHLLSNAPVPFLAEMATMGVVPPHSSGTSDSSSSPCLVRSTSAPGLSHLLMATMMGTWAVVRV